ncbi:MAG: NUDIX domain-containing protein [Flavobacterium sp.]|nr:NUDIX domain-containing protein [Flavobacterium sp.]
MQFPKIKILEEEVLSKNRYLLKKYTFEIEIAENIKQKQVREVYDRGNGATILLYNRPKKTIILIKQFRFPTYLNGNKTGMLIETCAGILEQENAEECIKRETEEETGFQINKVEKLFEAYMSPGAITEIIHFFKAEYSLDMKISEGGGLASEQENIEVIEMLFDDAYKMIATGAIKDAKTILLLQYAKINNLMV